MNRLVALGVVTVGLSGCTRPPTISLDSAAHLAAAEVVALNVAMRTSEDSIILLRWVACSPQPCRSPGEWSETTFTHLRAAFARGLESPAHRAMVAKFDSIGRELPGLTGNQWVTRVALGHPEREDSASFLIPVRLEGEALTPGPELRECFWATYSVFQVRHDSARGFVVAGERLGDHVDGACK